MTALLRPPIENDQFRTASSPHRNGIFKGPIQLRQSQNRDPQDSPAIREPSKSERNGWLKRKSVDLALSDADNERQLSIHTKFRSVYASEHRGESRRNGSDTHLEDTAHGSDFDDEMLDLPSSIVSPEPSPSSDSEHDLPTSPLHAKGLRIPNAMHHIEVPMTSEVLEIQERPQESIDLDRKRTGSLDLGLSFLGRPGTTLSSGRYFSKAVLQLNSPENVPHTITRRGSRREPDHDVRGSQAMFETQRGAQHVTVALVTGERRSQGQEGSLELGVTPRLKRKMSDVPFRPPFEEHLY